MNKNLVIVVALVILVVVAGLQAWQLTSLKSQLSDSSATLKTGSASSNVASTQSKAQSGLDNLPDMVGGC